MFIAYCDSVAEYSHGL